MRKGIRFRAYPNVSQQHIINSTFGCARLIYNKALAMRIEAFKAGEKTGYSQTSAMLTALKKEPEFAFLKEGDSIALQQALRDLDTAYKNFFEKRASYPHFKSKHDSRQSYRTLNQGNNIRIEGKRIKLPKIGWLKIRQSCEIGHIHNVTVERTPTGKYFVVLNVDFTPKEKTAPSKAVGLDLGIKSFYVSDDGTSCVNPKNTSKYERKLKREQRKLSRKEKGSSNRNKQRIKVAAVHEKISNCRNDFLHKESSKLINENQVICIEDLNVKGMVRNHKLAKSISDCSWSEFVRQLEYKASWYGNIIVKVPRFYASSQTCSYCGDKNPAVKDLKIRRWVCPTCSTEHDRDTNAAINILRKGLALVA